MKKLIAVISMLALMFTLVFAVACTPGDGSESLKGVTEDTIWVGNTAGTTGALATVGVPFNTGIEAAFKVYNDNGGFNDKQQVKLKHYDDENNQAKAVTLMETLIYDDEVFAIVGNFGTTSITANLDIIKEAKVPMVYAASGVDALFSENADEEQRYIFPVQPWNETEGRMLILRSLAPVADGGMGGTKVGVLSNTNEASQAMLKGIKAEVANFPESEKAKIVYQEVTGTDYSAAINYFKQQGCDVLVLPVIQDAFTACLAQMKASNYNAKVLTSYNNASTALITDAEFISDERPIYAQAWLDISSTTYVYATEGGLWDAYKALAASMGYPTMYDAGVPGFNESYWAVAEAIYDYCVSQDRSDAFAMSYNSYALAGYIAGDLFCKGLEALEESGKELTRANYVEIMERAEGFALAMADTIDFSNNSRTGVEAFSLTQFFSSYGVVSNVTVQSFNTIEEYRAKINK